MSSRWSMQYGSTALRYLNQSQENLGASAFNFGQVLDSFSPRLIEEVRFRSSINVLLISCYSVTLPLISEMLRATLLKPCTWNTISGDTNHYQGRSWKGVVHIVELEIRSVNCRYRLLLAVFMAILTFCVASQLGRKDSKLDFMA